MRFSRSRNHSTLSAWGQAWCGDGSHINNTACHREMARGFPAEGRFLEGGQDLKGQGEVSAPCNPGDEWSRTGGSVRWEERIRQIPGGINPLIGTCISMGSRGFVRPAGRGLSRRGSVHRSAFTPGADTHESRQDRGGNPQLPPFFPQRLMSALSGKLESRGNIPVRRKVSEGNVSDSSRARTK